MSAPARGRGGTATSRGNTSASRARGTSRSSTNNSGRGRGRGRGSAATTPTLKSSAGGLLQKLRAGTVQQSSDNSGTNNARGRGSSTRARLGASARAQGNNSRTFNNAQSSRPTTPLQSGSPVPPSSYRDFMNEMNERFQLLKPKRDAERKRAIQDGFLADPEKKTSLANAITPVGTCTDMCPQFERVERIVQNMVDRSEKIPNDATGRDMPSETRMVKRFRRSAAGYDEQLPSDIRTPETLKRTLDYLLDKVVDGGERLAAIHKFVWDRTRGIRNDFSIQQVSRKEDVKIAVECYERIARFHILSLHQLSNPDNLQEGEHFDAHQEREQLNNTLLSLMYYYEDNRGFIPLPNEPEFRSYCILFELQTLQPDLEDRMQAWPIELLSHPKVQTAFKIYAAAGNTITDQGPLRPTAPFSVAQSNSGKFWSILASPAVSYTMACVAEMNFSIVRFTALDAIWRSAKSSPQGQQSRNQDWTLAELQNFLAFDDEDQTIEFCEAFDLAFKNSDKGEQCLDFVAVSSNTLDKTSMPQHQIFSHGYVEEKRKRRTLKAVINGINVADAIRQGLVVDSSTGDEDEEHQQASDDDQSMFVPEESSLQASSPFGSSLNPFAPSFTPTSSFGQPATSSTPFGTPQQPSAFAVPATDASTKRGFSFSASNLQSANEDFEGETLASLQQTGTGALFGQTNTTQPSSLAPANIRSFAEIFGSKSTPSEAGTKSPNSFGNSNTISGAQKSKPVSSIFGQNNLGQTGVSQQASSLSNSGFGQTSHPLPQQSAKELQQNTQPNAGPLTGFGSKHIENSKPASSTPPRADSGLSNPTPPQMFAQQSQTQPAPLFSFDIPTSSLPPSTPEVTASKPTPVPSTESIFAKPSKPASEPVSAFSFTQPTPKSPNNLPQSKPAPLHSSLPTFVQPSTTPELSKVSQPIVQKSSDASLSTNAGRLPDSRPNDQLVKKFQTSQASEITQKSTPPPSSSSPPTLQQSTTPKFTKDDHRKLVQNTSRLILTQPQGLIEYFVSHHVSNILQTLVKQHLQEQQDEVMTSIRTSHLSRKFFKIWREKVQRSVLSKRSKHRRKLLVAAMQAEQSRKQRNEEELEMIIAATQETKRLQEQQRQLKAQSINTIHDDGPTQDKQNRAFATSVAGTKRKTTSVNDSPGFASGSSRPFMPTHKRTRTIGTVSEPSASLRLSTSINSTHKPNDTFNNSRFGQSLISRSTSSSDLRRSMTRKVDATKTDYFKLKAMGIDPNTPLIPDTARDLKRRRDTEQESRDILVARTKIRPSLFTTSVSSRQSTPAIQPPKQPLSIAVSTPQPSRQVPAQQSTTATEIEEDPFLRQLREARQSLAQDADWFKNQTAALEKELEDHEDFRRSQMSHVSSRQESPQISVDGLAKVNGYTYYPSEAKSGTTLSRTEQRIRKTGAHGFATRRIGADYVPVAMSRQSALRYTYRYDDDLTPVTFRPPRDDSESQSLTGNYLETNLPITKPAIKQSQDIHTPNKSKTNAVLAKSSLNAFTALQDLNSDEGEDNETNEAEDDAEGEFEDDEPNHYNHNAEDGDSEDNNEEYLESEGEEYEEDYDEDPVHQYALTNLPPEERYDEDDEEEYDDDDGTPGTYPQFSRAQSGSSAAQSGPGASADDALVLSD